MRIMRQWDGAVQIPRQLQSQRLWAADACEIYTDVDGVYTADPRMFPSARKLKEISYDEMQELASMGANVLHNRSVEMAKKYGVQLVVRSSMNREEGTVVKEVVKVEKLLISGVASW